jgi:hypothetical protein
MIQIMTDSMKFDGKIAAQMQLFEDRDEDCKFVKS